MPTNRDSGETTSKILAIFSLILIFFVIFLSGSLAQILDPKNKIKLHSLEHINGFRGSIKTIDGKTLASSSTSWYFAVNGKNYKKQNHPFIAKLIALYIDKSQKQILKMLEKNRRIVVSEDLRTKDAMALKRLSHSLDRMGMFVNFYNKGIPTRYGFEVTKNKDKKRSYPYKDLLSPILGFVNKSSSQSITGIEKFYDRLLSSRQDGWIYANKDILGTIVYNNSLEHQPAVDGSSIILNINSDLQKQIETILDKQKEFFKAKEVIASVMNSQTGQILALATSNRYDPNNIERVSHTKMSHIQYSFEPGSVIKPIVVARAIELGVVNRYDIFPAHRGRWKLGRKIITDGKKDLDWISTENIIAYSSNIGMSQIAMKLSGTQLRSSFELFGISQKSDIDLPYERSTTLPSSSMYDNSDIYKATSAYGYGFSTNFMRLMRAYNVFNNGGKLLSPRLSAKAFTNKGEELNANADEQDAIKPQTAKTMMSILRRTVLLGTAKKTQIDGVYIAGKTGTAHIAQTGGYANKYVASFFGFANDKSHKYTIGVTFIEPQTRHSGSTTATPTAKQIILALIKNSLLSPSDKQKN